MNTLYNSIPEDFDINKLINPLSPSRWQTYEKCPLSLFFKYSGLCVEEKGKMLIIGSLIHDVLWRITNDFIKEMDDKDFPADEELTDWIEERLKYHLDQVNIPEEIQKDLDLYRRVIPNSASFKMILEVIHKADTVLNEVKLALDENHQLCDFHSDKAYIRGIVDIGLRIGNHLHIIDHKTGWSKQDYITSVQLPFYAYIYFRGAQSQGVDIEKVTVHIHKVNENYIDSMDYSIEELEAFGKRIDAQIESMRDRKNWKPNVSVENCAYCPGKHLCEAYHKLLEIYDLKDAPSQEDLVKLYREYKAHEARAKELKRFLTAHIKAGILKGQEIDGKEIGKYVLKTAWLPKDKEEFIKFLIQAGISREEIWKNISITKTFVATFSKKTEIPRELLYEQVKEEFKLD